MLCKPWLLHPEPLHLWQATTNPYPHRRLSNPQRQVWLSLCWISGSWCTQGFVWALWASLVGMGFDSKCNFTLPTILLGLLLCPWTWDIFSWWDPTFSCQWLLTGVVILEFLQEKMSAHPYTPPSCDRIIVFHPKVDVYKGIPHTIHSLSEQHMPWEKYWASC